MTVLAELDHVSLARAGRQILVDVSLSVESNGVTAIVGPNGAGKSSLLKVLAGLISPGGGRVTWDGLGHGNLPALQRARLVAYLPQTREVHWPMPVRAVVALARLPHRALKVSTPAQDAAAVEAAMHQMTVAAFAERSVLALSGGELARVLMARALAQEPKLLLADEPTAGLDLAHQLELMTCMRDHAKAGGASVVTMHDLGLAARVADRIVLLSQGRIVAAGLPSDVLTAANIASVYQVSAIITEIDGVPIFVPHDRL